MHLYTTLVHCATIRKTALHSGYRFSQESGVRGDENTMMERRKNNFTGKEGGNMKKKKRTYRNNVR